MPARGGVGAASAVFYEEVLDLVKERVRGAPSLAGVPVHDLGVEISGAKSAHDMSPVEVAHAILRAVIAT